MNVKRKYYGICLSILILILGFLFYFMFSGDAGHLNENDYYNIKNRSNVNLIFYKSECPYCKVGKSEVLKQVKNTKFDTFFINADKKEGLEIAKKYHVKYAPTMVVIRDNDYKSFLYAHDKGKKIVVEKRKIKEAFEK